MGNYLGNLSQSPVKEGVGAEPSPSDVQAFEKSLCKLEALAGVVLPVSAPALKHISDPRVLKLVTKWHACVSTAHRRPFVVHRHARKRAIAKQRQGCIYAGIAPRPPHQHSTSALPMLSCMHPSHTSQ